MKKLLYLIPLFAAFAHESLSHGRYILPSHTLLSGDSQQSITLVSSISNDVFHPDMPLGDTQNTQVRPEFSGLFKQLDSTLTCPDGQSEEKIELTAFQRQSVGDVSLSKNGTYRISIVQPPTRMTTFIHADGSPDRVFGPAEPPEGASKIVRRQIMSRVETFVSKNQPSVAALKPTGNGLELGFLADSKINNSNHNTHPNDIFANEPVRFQLFFNGKPLSKPIKIEMTRAGTRHRNQRESKQLSTQNNGFVEMEFDQPGFYLLEAELDQTVQQQAEQQQKVDIKHYALYVTLEVFPQ